MVVHQLTFRVLSIQPGGRKMKRSVVLAGLFALLVVSAPAVELISIQSLTVTNADNPNGSNVTVTAVVTVGDYSLGGQISLDVRSTNGLTGQLFQPEPLYFEPADGPFQKSFTPGVCVWVSTDWNPYFVGDFVVRVTAQITNYFSLKVPLLPSAVCAVTVTVDRAIGGTVNSVQVQDEVLGGEKAYNPSGPWADIDLDRVYLHNVGVLSDASGFASIGCNLINVTNITRPMSPEEIDIALSLIHI